MRCIDFGSAFDDCEESSYDFSRNYLIRADQIPVIYRALGGDPDSAPPERIRQKIVAAMTECIRGAASAKALLDKWGVNYESFVPAR